MSLYKNLNTLRNEYIKKQPIEIKVFVVCDTKRDHMYYHFLFSEEGRVRNQPLLEKDYPDTSTLFSKIIEEFIKHKRMISMNYTTLKIVFRHEI